MSRSDFSFFARIIGILVILAALAVSAMHGRYPADLGELGRATHNLALTPGMFWLVFIGGALWFIGHLVDSFTVEPMKPETRMELILWACCFGAVAALMVVGVGSGIGMVVFAIIFAVIVNVLTAFGISDALALLGGLVIPYLVAGLADVRAILGR